MLTATVSVTYKGDWTSELGDFNVTGVFLASTFLDDYYLGLFSLEVGDVDGVVKIIRDHPAVESVDILEQSYSHSSKESATLLIREFRENEPTPAQLLHQHGYLPYGPTLLKYGDEYFDLLLETHDQLSEVIDLLKNSGTVRLEAVSQNFQRKVIPSIGEWQKILNSLSSRQLEVLNLAIERGYYDIPRKTTLEDIGNELEISKTTVSHQLRKSERKILDFFSHYMKIA